MIHELWRYERSFDLFEMPEPALERLWDRRDRRERTRRRVAGVVGVMIAVSVFGSLLRAVVTPPVPVTVPIVSPTTIDPGVPASSATLRAVLPGPKAWPMDLHHVGTTFGVLAVVSPIPRPSDEERERVQVGLENAVLTELEDDGRSLGALVAVYEDAASAAEAMQIYEASTRGATGDVEPSRVVDLGDEGLVFVDRSAPSRTYLWVRDRVLLFVHAAGDVGPTTVRVFTEQMDERLLSVHI